MCKKKYTSHKTRKKYSVLADDENIISTKLNLQVLFKKVLQYFRRGVVLKNVVFHYAQLQNTSINTKNNYRFNDLYKNIMQGII